MFVLLYKELEIALTINSHYSKHALMNKCPENIKVCRMSAYGKCYKTVNTSCLLKEPRQTMQTQIRLQQDLSCLLY